MNLRPHHEPRPTGLIASAVVLCWMIAGPCLGSSTLQAQRAAGGPYERTQAETVRRVTREILSEPRFMPRTTFWQRVGQWFSRWDAPDIDLGGAGTVLLWVLIIWCSLTLLAILAHLAWTVFVLVRSRGGGGITPRGPRFVRPEELSYEQLREAMLRAGREGKFREALRLMMLALLRWLDGAEAVSLHESKTNADYVREYSRELGGYTLFSDFTRRFDLLIYGGGKCDAASFKELIALSEQVRGNVRKRP